MTGLSAIFDRLPIGVLYPWVLVLLPLALLPLLRHGQSLLQYSSLRLLPTDRLSAALSLALRLIAAAAAIAIIVGLAGPFWPPQLIARIGQGAQMVVLLDRSSSMDRPFAGGFQSDNPLDSRLNSKGQVARQLLAEFASRRQQDMFGMLVFSTNPIQVMPLTDKQAIIQAAIAAGNIGRGLAKTNLGAGLVGALEFFAGKPYTGSRIVMLVSDGAAKLDIQTQERIQALMQRHRVALYWIYIRTRNSPGLDSGLDARTAQEIAPEQVLHQFFLSLEMPYRSYSAENPQALKQAIDDVSRLQTLPIRYQEVTPRRDLSGWCYSAALFLGLLLLAAKFMELRTWRPQNSG